MRVSRKDKEGYGQKQEDYEAFKKLIQHGRIETDKMVAGLPLTWRDVLDKFSIQYESEYTKDFLNLFPNPTKLLNPVSYRRYGYRDGILPHFKNYKHWDALRMDNLYSTRGGGTFWDAQRQCLVSCAIALQATHNAISDYKEAAVFGVVMDERSVEFYVAWRQHNADFDEDVFHMAMFWVIGVTDMIDTKDGHDKPGFFECSDVLLNIHEWASAEKNPTDRKRFIRDRLVEEFAKEEPHARLTAKPTIVIRALDLNDESGDDSSCT
ncbi:uncharacterized protein F4822DRAFT_445889 [Hypoxylon trugodes]|uniref:uncharacterized protein n=1 Tax=Hypoxylon trugodes TaxID=326681 RepID=UPI002192C2E4|nr:uncharacterized protein F4822DRAFT_445889 [Hypoxylon trugodes]KAI1384450.1 hypothetical protein F4822DRAFT_445889 [Hypoxylon trugodes]